MPVKLPKYAHWVAERRFLVDAGKAPKLDEAGARRMVENLLRDLAPGLSVEDVYSEGLG